jgi:hypothetical protein
MRCILHRSNRSQIAAESVVVAGVVEGLGEEPCEPEMLVELADRKQPGVAGDLAR